MTVAVPYALVFPGQGSQSLGMLKALSGQFAQVQSTLAEASAVLGDDLAARCANGPKEWLDATENTQPALLAASVAVWRVWQAQGVVPPAALAGHSLGEYSALVASEAIDFGDALRLVRLRGQLMQSAVPAGTGGMAAVIGMDDAAVAELCRQYPSEGLLAPANYNCPGQVVVAGHTAALDWLAANGKRLGARMVMRVGMSVPSHCALLKEAAGALAEALATTDIQAPKIPLLHNLDAAPQRAPDAIRAALAAQLYSPVQWTKTIGQLKAQGVGSYLECGPGKVLTGLIKRIDSEAQLVALEDPAALTAAADTLRS
jgi:[acyl-carrier-protein] S-malonyltransferase